MSWIISDDNQRKAIDEIEQLKSDRASALVAVAFLDNDLKNAIQARLQNNEDIFNKNFKHNGPIGGFEVKADIGYLLGIYDDDTREDLISMSVVRNLFAHSRIPLKFNSHDIKKECDKLRLVDRAEYPKIPGRGLPDQERSPDRLKPNAGARDRFILTVKLMAITFWANSVNLVLGTDVGRRKWVPRDS